MNTIDALRSLREAIANGDAAAVETALVEAERLAAIVPEIGVYMDGGLIQEVSRANDAPFILHVHDHDVEGTGNAICEMTWPGGATEEAVISTYDEKDDGPKVSQEYWNSLRHPVIVGDDEDDDEDGDDADQDGKDD